MSPVAAGFLAFAISAAALGLILMLPRLRDRVLDEPSVDRWHARATPAVGGVAMFLAFQIASLIGGLWDVESTRAVLIGATLLFAVGVVDDVRPMAPLGKLTLQAATVLMTMLAGIDLVVPDPAAIHLALGFVWMLLLINGVNIIDNMDGLAGGSSAVAAISVIVLANGARIDSLETMFAALLGALAGFLIYNVHPARVFMGDAGSLWLGLVVAAGAASPFSVNGVGGDSLFQWVLPAALCALPLADTVAVVVDRWRNDRPILKGGKDHLSHRLVQAGLSEQSSVTILWLMAALGGAVSIAMTKFSIEVWGVLAAVASVGVALLGSALLRRVPMST